MEYIRSIQTPRIQYMVYWITKRKLKVGWKYLHLKKFICKHIVGIALRLKYVKAPAASKNVPLGQKRKPGRPAKAKKALLIQ